MTLPGNFPQRLNQIGSDLILYRLRGRFGLWGLAIFFAQRRAIGRRLLFLAAGGRGVRAFRSARLALLERRAFAVGFGDSSASAGAAGVRERDQAALDLLKFRGVNG